MKYRLNSKRVINLIIIGMYFTENQRNCTNTILYRVSLKNFYTKSLRMKTIFRNNL